MTRALLTINFNHALCDNARRSMQASARRWGATFWEINDATPWRLPMAPNAYKTAAFLRSAFDEIFILDADMIVSARCPNPFEAFGGAGRAATSDASQREACYPLIAVANGSGRFGDYGQIKGAEHYEVTKLRAQEPRLAGAAYDPNTYFNTGMMLARRAAHAAMFQLAFDVCHVDHGLGWVDQTPLNLAATKLGVPVQLADERWNYIHPVMLGRGWEDMRTKDAFIYHFAGETGREHILPTVKWE